MPRRIRGGTKDNAFVDHPKKLFYALPSSRWLDAGSAGLFLFPEGTQGNPLQKSGTCCRRLFPPLFCQLSLFMKQPSERPTERPTRATNRREEEGRAQKSFFGWFKNTLSFVPPPDPTGHSHLGCPYPFYGLIFLSFFGDVYSLKSQKSKKSLYPTVFFHLKQYKTIRKFSCSCFFLVPGVITTSPLRIEVELQPVPAIQWHMFYTFLYLNKIMFTGSRVNQEIAFDYLR